MYNLKFLLAFLFIIFSFSIRADESVSAVADTIESWDNTIIDYRCASVETMDYYKARPEYKYDLVKEPESLLSRVLKWLASHFKVSDEGVTIFGWILLSLAILGLLLLIIQLTGIPIKSLFVFSKSTKVTQLKFGQSLVDLEKEKLDEMLTLYINSQAFREATRVLFLLTLRLLNRKNLIKWNAYKTDREYFYEIKESSLKDLFLNIIRQYEFIWFGKFDIIEEEFNSVKNDFENFMCLLEDKKAS